MRLAQIVDEHDKRALVVTARGESRLVKGARTTLELAGSGDRGRRADCARLIAERGVGKVVDLAAALKEKRVLLADRPQGPCASLSSPAPASPISALPRGATRCTRASPTPPTLTELDAHVQARPRGRQAEGRRTGRAARMVLQGRRLDARSRPGGDLVTPELRARRRRGAGDRRRLRHRPRRRSRCASASRSATNSPIM